MRKPIRSLEALESEHTKLEENFRRYLLTERGRDSIGDAIETAIERRSATRLKAVNAFTRTRFAAKTFEELRSHFAQNGVADAYFVTVISEEHVMPASGEGTYDPTPQRQWISRALKGMDYFGVIEPAYFWHAPFKDDATGGWISWHAHIIIWNTGRHRILTLKMEIDNSGAFVPGAASFHSRRFPADRVEEYVAYICKLPLSEYSASPGKPERDSAGGASATSNPVLVEYRTQKRQIRPGHFAELMVAMGTQDLSRFCVSGGEGTAVKAHVFSRLRKSLQLSQRVHDLRIMKLISGMPAKAAGSPKKVVRRKNRR